jgi:hypothetical protein
MLNNVEFFGALPYADFDAPAAGTAISPFSQVNFTYFYLENFDDGLLNTPGVRIREFATTNISTAFSDSVDGDDGIIDGRATGNTRSLFSNFTISSFTFEFSVDALGGQLPTHAGIVWTDIGQNGGGEPRPSDLIDNTYFEAFGPSGELLDRIGPFSLGDTSISRTTSEDRFFGVVNLDGISSIRLSMPGKNNWEADHLQYGRVLIDPNPQPDPGGDDGVIGMPEEDMNLGFDGNNTILDLGDYAFSFSGVSDDILLGRVYSRTLLGEIEDDLLNGGIANDVIATEPGHDLTVLQLMQGFDSVNDFQNNQDKANSVLMCSTHSSQGAGFFRESLCPQSVLSHWSHDHRAFGSKFSHPVLSSSDALQC